MKRIAATALIVMVSFTLGAYANDALLEQVLLLRLTEEADIGDYGMIEVLQGYGEYRAMMDNLEGKRADTCAALKAAIEADESSSKIMSLTRELMNIDMDILRARQSSVSEAGDVLGAKAMAQLYLIVSDMAAAKDALIAELTGQPAAGACPLTGQPCPMAAQPCAGAVPALSPEEAIMERVMVFLNKLAQKDLDGAMAAVADDFEHYDFRTKAQLRAFLDDAIATGYLDDIEILTEDAEVKIDGDKAVLYPIDITGIFGTVTLELVGEMRDGQYMLVSMDAFGI
ncbi:MAG TPA: hypothetical protein ENN29_12085 [Candidatus Hydrogenedentes bacterium]|nr:hypothetical protein [Candidatus Hydrogenedentota bacterium]